MEKLQIETDKYILYSPDSLKYITDNMLPILEKKIEEYKKLFKIPNYRKIQINYFDDLDKFRNFIYDLRGEKESLPKYARGTYDNGMINSYIEPNIILNSQRLYTASHELFHIMYMDLILNQDYSKRIVWYDEGMAQFNSGEKDLLLDEENLESYFQKVKIETKIIPNMNEIEHGDSFCNENYNGYDLSYLAVKYLKDTLSNDEFLSLLNNFDKIKEYGKTIVYDMFEYYDNKFMKKVI